MTLARPGRLHSSSSSPFEFNFGAQPLEISMDDRDRQFLSSAPVTDRTVSLIQRPIDLDIVPPFRVADIGEAEIVLLGPEERNGVKPFAPAQDIARSRLPLALGGDKMLDPDALACEQIWPTGDVTGGKNARRARLEILVDGDTTVHGQTGVLGKRGLWPNADADDDEVGLSFSPFSSVTLRSSIDERRRTK